jgi:hypothetical protein
MPASGIFRVLRLASLDRNDYKMLNASTTKAVTIAITGTLTLFWINLGDF